MAARTTAAAAAMVALAATITLAPQVGARSGSDTSENHPVVQATPPPRPVSFLATVAAEGTSDVRSLGWQPRQGVEAAAIAQRFDDGTALVGLSEGDGVCLVLVLADWQPESCTTRAAAATGGFFIAAQAAPDAPRFVAGIAPDGATVVADGTPVDVTNNVWVTVTPASARIELHGPDGTVTPLVHQ